jgi:hypothetical protein
MTMLVLLNLLTPLQVPKIEQQMQVPAFEDPSVIQQAVNPVVASPAAPQVQIQAPAAPVASVMDPAQYLGGIMSQAPKATVYNMQDEKTLRNMARGQKVGDFLTLLSDAIGVSKGAPVAARQFTSTSPYLQKILENRARYQANLEDFQNKDFARKIAMASEQAKLAEARINAAQRAAQFGLTYGLNKQKADTDAAYKQWLRDRGIASDALSKEKFEEGKKQFAKTYGLKAQQVAQGEERLGMAKEKADKTKAGKPFTYANYKNTEVPIMEGEFGNLLQAGLRRAGKGEGEIKTLMARYQHQPTEEYKQIARMEKVKQLEEAEIPMGTPLQPAIPSIPALDPGYGIIGGHTKSNASTGGLY